MKISIEHLPVSKQQELQAIIKLIVESVIRRNRFFTAAMPPVNGKRTDIPLWGTIFYS
jgi:hypothetical protein